MVAIRHQIHANPELAYEEFATSRPGGRAAAALGLRGAPRPGRHRRGRHAARALATRTRRIGLRADMDALPIAETSGKPWASKVFGKMHACGHDGHTAMLLSAARHLAATRNFDGIVHLVFQPAEEGLAGARKMLEDGFLELFPCDAMFGMHNMPGLPAGQFAAVPGFAMASGDTCIITVKRHRRPRRDAAPCGGRGGGGASIVMALQTIVARNVPRCTPASSRWAPSCRRCAQRHPGTAPSCA
jgi:hippurate hydrolase